MADRAHELVVLERPDEALERRGEGDGCGHLAPRPPLGGPLELDGAHAKPQPRDPYAQPVQSGHDVGGEHGQLT
ncbi:MAG TPA: hypothetical protein PLR99_22550 [Polyangiaceae bacterium]|nr:hypothetical protein [Polyangiaceae bacterium]